MSEEIDAVLRAYGLRGLKGAVEKEGRVATYRTAPTRVQERFLKEDSFESWRDEDYWSSVAKRYLADLGIGFVVSPWVAGWERIWGATPIEDYARYKEMYSVHKDRPLIILWNKEVKIFTFEELWNELAKKFKVQYNGQEEIIIIPYQQNKKEEEQFTIKTLSALNRYCGLKKDQTASRSHYGAWRRINYIVRHRFTGDLIRLQQRNGETIVTPNHSVYDENFNLVKPESNPNLMKIRRIAKFEELPERDELIIDIPLITTVSKKVPMPNGGYRIRTYQTQYVVSRKLSGVALQNFAYFLGAYVSEGYIYYKDGKAKGITISNSDKQYLQRLATYVPSFMNRPNAPIYKEGRVYALTILSRDLAQIVEQYCGRYCKHKQVPSFIFTAPKEVKKAFLEGYSFGDGLKKALLKGVYSGTTISPKLVAGLSLLFTQLGSSFGISYGLTKGNNRSYEIKQTKWYTNLYRRNKIEKIAYDDYVYDIEVDGLHNFVDGVGLVVLHNTRVPFISSAIDLQVNLCAAKGFIISYQGPEEVKKEIEKHLERFDINNLARIIFTDMLVFGNAYVEIIRRWRCKSKDHQESDLPSLSDNPDYRKVNGGIIFETDLREKAVEHLQKYPDHEFESKYGEVIALKPLDPYYMRLNRDPWGSHPPDERLIFFNDNRLVLEPLGEYVSKNATKENTSYISNETRLIQHPFILPSMEKDKVVLNVSPHLIEHYYSGDMYDIYTMYGSKVRATGNHSVFTWKPKHKNHTFPGELELKETRDIKVGDYVLISRKFPVFKEVPLDIKVSRIFMENMTIEELHDFGIQSNSLKVEDYKNKLLEYLRKKNIKYPELDYNHYKKKHILPLDFVKEANISVPDDAIIIGWHAKTEIKDKLEPNGLLYLLGLLLSDGCLSTDKKRTGKVLFSGDSVENNTFLEAWLKENSIKFSKKIDKRERLIWKEQKNLVSVPNLSIYNRALYSLCKLLLPQEKKLPSWLYTLPLSQLKYFIKGLWDGDGWHKDTRITFRYFTRDKRLAEDLILLLKRFGIVASLSMREGRGKKLDYDVQAYVEPLDILDWDKGVKQRTRASAYGDFLIVKVKKIEKSFYKGPVYDFEVPGSESYLSSSGILVHNTVLGYIQLLTVPPVKFTADQILHIRFKAKSWNFESAYGTSILRSLLFHEALIDELEKNMGAIVATYLKPMLVVKIGSADPNAPEITDEQYDAIVKAFAGRQATTDIFVRQGLINDVITINPPIAGVQAGEWWLNYLKEQREFALGVPKIFAGQPEKSNRATAQMVMQEFITRLTSLQESFSSQFEKQIFVAIIKSKFENWKELIDKFGIPKISWNPIIEEDPTQTLQYAVQGWSAGLLTRDEARKKLGLPQLDKNVYGNIGDMILRPDLAQQAALHGGLNPSIVPAGGAEVGPRGPQDQFKKVQDLQKEETPEGIEEKLSEAIDSGIITVDEARQWLEEKGEVTPKRRKK